MQKFVKCNGVDVIEGWPEKIEDAQRSPTVFINSKEYGRVRYGEEEGYKSADVRPCKDCAVIKGQFHVRGCDTERCPACGGQAMGCECLELIH
jgi:hypothetical protein